jgi:hypothetical protein
MASTLPNVKQSFNINTLKSSLDAPVIAIEKKAPITASSLTDLAKKDFYPYLVVFKERLIELIRDTDVRTYDELTEQDELPEHFHDFYELQDTHFNIVQSELYKIDQEIIDSAYADYVKTDNRLLNMSFETINWKTLGYAYRKYLKDTLYCFLEEVDDFYHDKNHKEIKLFNDNELHQWLLTAAKLWEDDNALSCFENAVAIVTGPKEHNYEVCVRAVISGNDSFLQEYELPDSWSSYDYQSDDEDNGTLRADCIVSVKATSREEAFATAQADAPNLNIGGKASVDLWIDEDQEDDIQLIK